MKKITVMHTQFSNIAVQTEKNQNNENESIGGIVISNSAKSSVLNHIYAAKVINAVESLEGAFLEIGLSQNAFISKKSLCIALGLKLSEYMKQPMKAWVKPGQLVLAQVDREPYQTKGAKLTHDISLEGKYFILLPNGKGIKYSKKLRAVTLSEPLNNMIQSLELEGSGLIIRSQITNAIAIELIKNDFNQLISEWLQIRKTFDLQPTYKCLYKANDFYDNIYRTLFDEDVVEVMCDNVSGYEAMAEKGISKTLFSKKKFDILSMVKYIQMIRTMLTATCYDIKNMRFSMDELEAFTIVDVNSSKKTGMQEKAKMAFEVNSEIAVAVKRYLLIRQISGIIIIDFIKMDGKRSKLFLEMMSNEVFTGEDDFTIQGYSTLGLFEMTRKRKVPSIMEQLSFDYLNKDLHFLDLIEIQAEIIRAIEHTNVKGMTLKVSEPLFIFLSQKPFKASIEIKLEKDKHKHSNYYLNHLK